MPPGPNTNKFTRLINVHTSGGIDVLLRPEADDDDSPETATTRT